MASLLNWLGKQAKGVVAEVNPFDNGQTYNTVVNRAPVQHPQPRPQLQQPPQVARQRPAVTPRPVGFNSSEVRLTPQMRTRLDQQLNRGQSFENASDQLGLGVEEIRSYTNATRPGYGIKPFTPASAVAGAGNFVKTMADSVADIVQKPVATLAPRQDRENAYQALRGAYSRGEISQGKFNEEATKLSKDVIGIKTITNDRGFAQNVNQSPLEFTKSSADAGYNAASVLPVARGAQLATNTAKGAFKPLVKEALAWGTVDTANDAVQGRLSPEGVLLNYGLNAALPGAGYAAPRVLGKSAQAIGSTPQGQALIKGIDSMQAAQEASAMRAMAVRDELITARQNMQRAFDVETDPVRRSQINKGLAQINAQLKSAGFIGGPSAKGFKAAQARGEVFDGVDGKPRFEVDDSGAKILDDYFDERQLQDVLDHPDLYKNYPELKNLKIVEQPALRSQNTKGVYDAKNNAIAVNPDLLRNPDALRSTILHEVQHAIQNKEGFANGGGLNEFRSKKLADIYRKQAEIEKQLREQNPVGKPMQITRVVEKNPMEALWKKKENLAKQAERVLRGKMDDKFVGQYRNLAGEAEARAVQSRMNMPMSERYVKPDPIVNPKTGETLSQSVKKLEGFGWSKSDIEKYKNSVLNGAPKKVADEGVLDNLNPTGGLYVDYTPKVRATAKLAENMTTLDKTVGGSPDDLITIYRGAPKNQSKIVPGDFVTTNRLTAQNYTDGNVLEMQVRKGDVLDDLDEPGRGEESLYRPNADKETRVTRKSVQTKEAVNPRSTFYDSLDVPKEDLIIRNGDGKAMSVDPSKVAPSVKAKVETLKAEQDTTPLTKENGRFIQSNDMMPDNVGGTVSRRIQGINKKADDAIKSVYRLETQKNLSNGLPLGEARKAAEEAVLARPDLADMLKNRTEAIAKTIEEGSVKQIDVKTPRKSTAQEFVAVQSNDDAGKASLELVPLDNEKHTLRNGTVVGKDGKIVGSYVGIDEDGNQFAYVEGKPVNINKVIGDIDRWGNINKAFTDMDRLIEMNAPDKATARKVQEFTTVYKDSQEAQMKTQLAAYRSKFMDVEKRIMKNKPANVKKEELSKDMFRMIEKKVDMNEMRQKYGADFIDKEVAPTLQWARKTFDTILEDTNKVLVRNGFDPIPRRDNYITHIQEDPTFWSKVGIGIQDLNPFGTSISSDINPGTVRGGIPDEIVGNTDNTSARRRWNPFAQERKGNSAKQDFFAALDAYVEPMMFNQYMTPAASRARIIERSFRTYEKAKQIKFDQLSEVVGLEEAKKLTPTKVPHKNFKENRRSPMVLAWQEYGNMLAGKTNKLDRKIMELGEGASGFMDKSVKAQGIVGASSIPGSSTAALAQVLSIPQTIGRDSALSVLKASKDMMFYGGGKGTPSDPMRQSSFMRARYTDATSRRRSVGQKYVKAAAKPMEVIEREISEFSWRSAYHEAMKKGQTGTEAVRTADIEAKKTIAGRGVGDRPVAMNSKALGLVTQFGLEVNNSRIQFFNDFSPAQKVKYAVAAAALNTVYGAVTGQTPLPDFISAALDTVGDMSDSSDDSKDDTKTNIIQGGQRVAGEASKFIPGAPTIAGMLMSDRDREEVFGKNGDLSRFGTPAASRVITATTDAVKGVADGSVKDVLKATSSLVPTGSQIKRTAEGAEALAKGYTETGTGKVQNAIDNKDPLNWAQGLLFGKYSLPGQQDAMNRGLKLSDGQSVRFKEMYDKNPKEAIDYLNSINARKADNPRKGTLTDTGRNEASAATSATSATMLLEENKARSEKLKSMLSPSDYDIVQLSKSDRQKLIANGSLTQEKVDGLMGYYDAKRKELGYEDDSTEETKTYKQKYDDAKKDYDKNSKSWSIVEKAKKDKEFKKLTVQKDYDNDTVGLYGMSKGDVYELVSRDPDGNKYVEKIIKYGDALVDAGLETKNKFRDKYGNIDLNASHTVAGKKATASKKASKASAKSKATAGKAIVSLQESLNGIRVPKTTGNSSALKSSLPTPPQLKKSVLRKYSVKGAKLSKKDTKITAKKA